MGTELTQEANRTLDMAGALKVMKALVLDTGTFTDDDLSVYGVFTLVNTAQMIARGIGMSDDDVRTVFEKSFSTFEGVDIPLAPGHSKGEN